MKIDEIRLSAEEIGMTWSFGMRSEDGTTAPERMANTATDKAIEKMIMWVEKYYSPASGMIVIDSFWEDWQSLKKLVKEGA